MESITVFTPTYNRAYILPKLYKSLVNQTNKDFRWLIVDDGSTDETKELVENWKKEGKIPIDYIEQENKGMVGAHNTALYNIKTELNICIDSDDHMPSDGIEVILQTWNFLTDKSKYIGLIGLDSYKDGEIVGDKFPSSLKECLFAEFRQKYKIKGDKKYVTRTEVVQSKLPYPEIENEKFPSTSYLYLLFGDEYKFFLINEVLCIVEYLPDGNSMNKIKQYRESPNAFALYRIGQMKSSVNYKNRFKSAIHYVSSSILAKDSKFIKKSPYKITTFLAVPFGFLLSLYIKYTKKSAVSRSLNKK